MPIPVEGLNVLFDLNRVEVVRVIDQGVHEVPMTSSNYQAERPEIAELLRGDLKPIDIDQPDGPSFTVEDRVVTWANWRFHVEFHPREGLVLNDIQVRGGEKAPWRPLAWRASISEMVVPYGDPSFNHYRKNAFDVGEYGLGQVANPLKLGCDCRGHIHYFDGVFTPDLGRAGGGRQRHLPARGRRRHAVEAYRLHDRRHGSSPGAQAAGLHDRDGRQLRIRLLLGLPYGRDAGSWTSRRPGS